MKYCLFHPESPVWRTDLHNELVDLIRKGENDTTIYKNARDLFELLADGVKRGIDPVGAQDVKKTLSDGEFVGALWGTVMSRGGIQYRLQMTFLNARQLMIQNGAPEAAMPLSKELQARVQEEQLKTNSQPQPTNGTVDTLDASARTNPTVLETQLEQ